VSRTIVLTQGQVAIVDDEDFEWLNRHKWTYLPSTHTGYAHRRVYQKREYIKDILMHRVILNAPPGMQTDHRNMNGLDNRRVNLRMCTNSQNHMNTRKRSNCVSIYKGVSWHKLAGKWRAQIKANNRRKHLGLFNSEEEAALAYDIAALKFFSEFARLNNPPKETEPAKEEMP